MRPNIGEKMTALITGASGGIGLELARLFAADGYDLILIARRAEKLNELKEELEGSKEMKVWVLSKDLTSPFSPQEIFDFTKANDISVDVLVNNAGFGDWGFFAQSKLLKQREMISLNVTALTTLTHLFLPQMIERKSGRILNVASVASFMPGAKMAVYYATKAFVRSFSEALSVELKEIKSGVTVTALCPGPVKTEFWERAESADSSISSHLFFARQDFVARYAYKSLMKGKVLAIPGFSVRAMVFLTKFLPRSWVRNMVYMIQK